MTFSEFLGQCAACGGTVSSSKVRDSSLPSTIKHDLCYLALVGIIIAIIIAIYNIL